MAGAARRSLASAFTLLSRRPHPSLSHLLLHHPDRHRTEPRSLFPSPPAHREATALGFPLHLVLRSYSSWSTSSSDGADDIKDVSNVLIGAADAASAVPAPFPGEVAAAASDSFPTVAAMQHFIDLVHSFTGFNWWASIALTTLMIQGAMLPMMLDLSTRIIKLEACRDAVEELEKLIDHAESSMGMQTMMEIQEKMEALCKNYASLKGSFNSRIGDMVIPSPSRLGQFLVLPVFSSLIMAILNMIEKVSSLKGGGAYWFTDLTTPDPSLILPIWAGLSTLAVFELFCPVSGSPKNSSNTLCFLVIAMFAIMPKGVFFFVIPSNLFFIVYAAVLEHPSVRKFLVPGCSSS